MKVDEYASCDATELAGLIRDRQVSSEEVFEIADAAIRNVNEELNAVAAGPFHEPLHFSSDGVFAGVPFVVKEILAHIADVPTRMGSRLAGENLSFPDDTYLIQQFREAGLAIVATSTTPELGCNANTEAVVYGSTRNPWDTSRTAGGSSGGTGALVAAGAVPLGHANDGGGSTRIPAACNGLVGLKPSRGRVSLGPDLQEALAGLAAEFGHTRTMRDCAALLDAVSRPMPGDKFIIKQPSRPWSEEVGADPGKLRIAIRTESWSEVDVDPQVVDAVEAVGRQLEGMGHHVEHVSPTFDWDQVLATMGSLFNWFAADAIEQIVELTGNKPDEDTLEHVTLALYEAGRNMTGLEVFDALRAMTAISATFADLFAEWDLLLTPTMNTPPLELGYLDANDPKYDADSWWRLVYGVSSFTPLFNITGNPAISLPLGESSEGLPIGVQLVASMCDEATLIQVGSQLESAMPWRERRPKVHASRLEGVTGNVS